MGSNTFKAFWAFAVVAWLGLHAATAQLAVVNGGFEGFEALPSASGQLDRVEGWTNGGSPLAIPDYYHENGSGGGDLPQTPMAKVSPFAGRAIAGFVAYTEEADPMHEYLTGTFSEPLEVGKRYKMSFSITSGRVHDWVEAGVGVSGLGIALGHSVPEQEAYESLSMPAQFTLHETLYTRQWRTVQFVFAASEQFTHFTLGRLGSELRIRKDEGEERTMAYYFVDAFSIEPVETDLTVDALPGRGPRPIRLPDGVFMPNAFTPNADSTNDAWIPVVTDDLGWACSVVNRWGEVVWRADGLEAIEKGWQGEGLNGEPCLGGVYAWRLTVKEPLDGQMAWQGVVNLIR